MSKQDAIQDLLNQAAKLQKMAFLLEKHIPDNLPDNVGIWASKRNLRLDIPHNPDLLKQILEILGPKWKFTHSGFSEQYAWTHNTYIHEDGTELVITMEAKKAGSTCQLQQSVKEIPVYKVVCS